MKNPNAPPRQGQAEALFVDLYELTMMQAYLHEGLTGPAVFSLFCRRLPPARNYLLACGLETVLEAIETLRFSEDDLAYLASLGKFTSGFLDWLRTFRFTGDIHAVAEGTPVFANEPLLEVVAPLPEAQFFETLIMNQVHVQTLLASKAARVVTAAKGRPVIDFGARRMHGFDAADKAARALYIAGVTATSNVAGASRFGVPAAGTMGHSYIQAHGIEADAFQAFAGMYPGTVLLVDTYDTVAAARTVIDLARKHGDRFQVSALRLDSGDLDALSRQVRQLLDEADLQRIKIFASGGLDEHEIGKLVAAGAPIDSFGVGTSMGVSADAPGLDIAYKLTEYDGTGRMKLSTAKATLPGRKQVFRSETNGRYMGDVIARADEALAGTPLLTCVMKNGRRVDGKARSLEDIRTAAAEALERLPPELLSLAPAHPPYPVEVSSALSAYDAEVRRQIAEMSGKISTVAGG